MIRTLCLTTIDGRRIVYEYHKVGILKSKISNSTAVEVLPLPSKSKSAELFTVGSIWLLFVLGWNENVTFSGYSRAVLIWHKTD